MALMDYKRDMEMCCRCSSCKFIPFEKVSNANHTEVCPSISRYNFHAYSAAGRIAIAQSMAENRIEYSDKLLELVYNCQMCGACDISCKYNMDMDVLNPITEFRIQCVKDGNTLPVLDKAVKNMETQNSMVAGNKAHRGDWAQGLNVKNYTQEKTEVLYHAGCRTSYNKDLWKIAKATVSLMLDAGVDVGIGGTEECCCGGRAYYMGYEEEFLNQARKNMERIRQSGVKTLVTGCAECYHAFKVLYEKFNLKGELEVLHTSEYFSRLIEEKRIVPKNKVSAKVTYHDPCYLGRLGENYIHYEGKEIPGHVRIFDPPREFMRGTYGIYDAPREVLNSIPGLQLVEMDRIKEYAWCCGAGGGVKEVNPDFATWTAEKRIEEAESTDAEILVTACPGCQEIFAKTINSNGNKMQVCDLVELLYQATTAEGDR